MEERLRKFAALVELGSFTKAAESLHVSQPALSSSIKKLERELKDSLLVRGTQPLTLTAAGKQAYIAAKEIYTSTNNLTHKLEQLRQQKPAVSIGMIDSVAQAVFSYSSAFAVLERNAHISLVVDNSRNLLDAVRKGELDIAFVVEPSMQSAEEPFQYTSVGSEPLLTVCREDELPIIQAAIAHGQLSPFISYDRSSNTFRLIAQAYTRAHIRLRPTFYSTSPSVMLQLASVGRGAAVLPYLLVREMLTSRQLIFIPIGNNRIINRPIAYITQNGRELPLPLSTIVWEVREVLAKLESHSKDSLREIDKTVH
jgi:DNA-binding transcriptional LysR family regulator